MNEKTILVIGGVATVAIVAYFLYQKQAAKIAAIQSTPQNILNTGVANAGASLLATGASAANGIVSGVGNTLSSIFNGFSGGNSSGIFQPTDTTTSVSTS